MNLWKGKVCRLQNNAAMEKFALSVHIFQFCILFILISEFDVICIFYTLLI